MAKLNATCPQISVPRTSEGDARRAILGLRGIFWALNMLVVHQTADEIAHEADLAGGIANLITAGELLADEISGRF